MSKKKRTIYSGLIIDTVWVPQRCCSNTSELIISINQSNEMDKFEYCYVEVCKKGFWVPKNIKVKERKEYVMQQLICGYAENQYLHGDVLVEIKDA